MLLQVLTLATSLLQAPEVGPLPPAGTSEAFQKTVLAVEGKLSQGEFAQAATLAARLPKESITITWDDSAAPKERRAELLKARDAGAAMWTKAYSGLKIGWGKGGDIKIGFVDKLPANQESQGPAGAVLFTSDDPSEPRVEAVIALRRGPDAEPAYASEITNEVGYAIGAYLGLARHVYGTTVMARTDRHTKAPGLVQRDDVLTARATVAVASALREAAAKRKKLAPATPEAVVSPTSIDFGEVSEGTVLHPTLQVSNQGNAPLSFYAVPDCGCLQVSFDGLAKPGVASLVKLAIDTTHFPGKFVKALYIYSNDADFPVRRIPITGTVRPVYRFLVPGGSRPVVVGEDGAKIDLYLSLDQKDPIQVSDLTVTGGSAVAAIEPWSGEMADPEVGEGVAPRKGYKITVLVSPSILPGRVPVTVALKTNHKVFDVIRHTIMVQRGIVAEPLSVYLGELGKEKAEAWFLLTQPGKPFKIRKVSCDTDNLSATYEKRKEEWEYKVTVRYDGKAPLGALNGNVVIETDDPWQPVLKVPVRGSVR